MSDSNIKSELPTILLDYSKQIVLGMQYLSSKAFVHRDLAARNVLITKERICKVRSLDNLNTLKYSDLFIQIADFGLSRDLAEGNYYVSHGGMVPIKWTAPEAVLFMKYSTASDVWSYGCLLYEIWSLGRNPFEGLTNIEVIIYWCKHACGCWVRNCIQTVCLPLKALQKVNTGYRLPPPSGCPLLIYQMMIKCW